MARAGSEVPARPTRGRRRAGGALAVAVIAAALLAGGWLWWSSRSGSATGAAPATPTPSVTLSPARATEIAQQMTSGDETQLRQAVALPSRAPLDPALIPGLTGLTIGIDAGSYTATGADTAMVQAEVTDAAGAASTWTLDLVLTKDGTWQVVDTVPQGSR